MLGASDGCAMHPAPHRSSRIDPGALEDALEHQRQQVFGQQGAQRSAMIPSRGPNPINNDHVFHSDSPLVVNLGPMLRSAYCVTCCSSVAICFN
jgi:hypothetical protein